MRTPERRALLCVAWVVALLMAVPAVAHAHGPLAPYRWVRPPVDVASTNVAPLERRTELPAQRDRIAATEVWTGDLQAVLSLADTPLPVRDRSSVSVVIAPLDASTLGRLPGALVADGNAYDISLTDGDERLGPLATPGNVILDVPHEATGVLFSTDGIAWSPLEVGHPAPNQVEAPYARSGYYLAVVDHPLSGGSSAGGVSGPLLVALVALPVLAVAGLLLVGRRSARQRAAVST